MDNLSKKLNLEELKVQSFVTDLEGSIREANEYEIGAMSGTDPSGCICCCPPTSLNLDYEQ